jgi:hypothetical protein
MHLSDPPFLPPHPSATTHGAAAAGGARTMQDETRQLLTSETWSVQLLCAQQVQLRPAPTHCGHAARIRTAAQKAWAWEKVSL